MTSDPDDNPFWGEPIPTDLWEDMDKLNKLYEQLEWSHRDYLEIAIEGNHITIRNKSREGRQCQKIKIYYVGVNGQFHQTQDG